MLEERATVGATDGNIIAAIITTHTPTNQASVPRSVHGPPSMLCISSTVHHQHAAASTKRRAISPSRVRAAAKAGASPPVPGARSCAEAIKRSGGPRELGGRKCRLPVVLDAKSVDPRPRRLGSREVWRNRVEHAVEAHRLSGLDPEGDDVLDLEVDRVADANAVTQAVVDDFDRNTLNTEHLADKRSQPCHRSSLLSAEDRRELLRLLVRGVLVDEHAELPVSLGHDLRRVRDRGDFETAHVRALDLALADVEDEGHAAVVVCRPVVERKIARAHEIAGARLDVAALETPGHEDLLIRGTGRGDSRPTCGMCQPSRTGARSQPHARNSGMS